MSILHNKAYRIFLIKFLVMFCLLYFGTKAVIGFSAEGNYYSSFVQQHLDYISWLRRILLSGTKVLLSLFGITTYSTPDFRLRIPGGRGIYLAYDCLGYGVMSFWIAYVFASGKSFVKKACWIIGGVLLIYFINISRIGLFLLAINRGWKMPLGIDHHTWFSIVAYIAIFIMIYFFERSKKNTSLKMKEQLL